MKQAPIYLDFATTTPVSDTVLQAMKPYWQEEFYNPSALYLGAKKVRKALEDARSSCAKVLQVRPSEIIFTAGSTEANSILIRGVMERYKDAHCVVSAIEHDSVLVTARDYKHTVSSVNDKGIIDLQNMAKCINEETVLVCCMAANNEVGTVQPIKDIVKIVEAERIMRHKNGNKKPIFLHVDTSQSFNYINMHPHKLGVDSAVIGGSKIYGPKQTALLFCRSGIGIKPLITGGGQEFGIRSGTENVPGFIGLAVAVKEADDLRDTESERLKQLQQYCIAQLNLKFNDISYNGSLKHRLPNNIHFTIKGIDNELLVMQLDEMGIMAATGSACHASSDEPSSVLTAMGIGNEDARSSIRVTFGRTTTKKQIDQLLVALEHILRR